MTGEGIYYAVATGIIAGRVAAERHGDAGRAYRRSVRALLAGHLRHTAATSRVSRVPALVDAGLRAASGDQRVFDDLVEIGLGRGRVTARLLGGLVANLSPPRDEPEPTYVR
jgi:flavin-dependent dehydrogenase